MKHIRNLSAVVVALAASLALTSPAYAAGVISGQRINLIGVYGSTTTPYTVLTFSVAATTPACAGFTNVMAIDTSTNRGKAQANLVTAAYLAGKNVTVTGTGSCVTPAGFPVTVEAIAYVSVQ